MAADYEFKTIKVTTIKPRFVAIVEGVDWNPLSDEQFIEIVRARIIHPVLCFRGDKVPEEAMIKLAERFGTIVIQPLQRKGGPGWHGKHVKIYRITTSYHEPAKGEKEKTNDLERHSDLWYKPDNEMPTDVFMWAVKLPQNGPPTSFYNTYALRENLPKELLEFLVGKWAMTQSAYSKKGGLFHKVPKPENHIPVFNRPMLQTDAFGQEFVCTGPETYLKMIVGQSEDKSLEIFGKLDKALLSEENRYDHVWQPDDCVFFSNELQHGRGPFQAVEIGQDGKEEFKRMLDRITFRTYREELVNIDGIEEIIEGIGGL